MPFGASRRSVSIGSGVVSRARNPRMLSFSLMAIFDPPCLLLFSASLSPLPPLRPSLRPKRSSSKSASSALVAAGLFTALVLHYLNTELAKRATRQWPPDPRGIPSDGPCDDPGNDPCDGHCDGPPADRIWRKRPRQLIFQYHILQADKPARLGASLHPRFWRPPGHP